ncbi:MAG: glycosyl hydrolase 53 family protein [Flavobacterium sp.]|uniref:glycoside hydrolase family 53 protein n=1 Tax=Flavobacterium sp. TaxID=239 RepID=UPI001DA07B83|nr:glycosyl hydrolase 53 family protein [Flavobacterium sp.]
MKKIILLIPLLFILLNCSDNENTGENEPIIPEDNFIRAADLSFLPLIESEGTIYFNATNQPENALTTLKNAGCNTVRIRLWKDPIDNQSGFEQVKTFAARIKQAGMKVWLTVHYSDTWADPGQQTTPEVWNGLSFTNLKNEMVAYTETIMTEIQPDIIQIGNEINSGLLWPQGHLINNESQCLALLNAASAAIRSHSASTKIMLHYAGIGSGATWFFSKMNTIDYDYIGLSYYPIWHGKNLSELESIINSLSQTHNKKVVIAETSYPFTLGWNDWTNNIVGLEEQIITSYPATPEGQKNYLLAIKSMLQQTESGIGFAYWGGEWVAFRGEQSTNGSSWENQALWDFENKALPIITVFNQ